MMDLPAAGRGRLHIGRVVVDEQHGFGGLAEAVLCQREDRRGGLGQLFLARDDYRAEAIEDRRGGAKAGPELGPEIGDGE